MEVGAGETPGGLRVTLLGLQSLGPGTLSRLPAHTSHRVGGSFRGRAATRAAPSGVPSVVPSAARGRLG